MSNPHTSGGDQTPGSPQEAGRLAALRDLQLLDTPREAAFDDITALVADICQTPIALISLIDESRQWFKSAVGLTEQQTPREVAFCAHALDKPDLLLVPDAAQDPRFAANPLVTGEPHIRFYAGAPLVTPEGHTLGTLCVIDRVPRQLNERQLAALRVLGRQVMTELQLRRRLLDFGRVEQALRQSEREQRMLVQSLETQRARLVEAQAVAKVGSWETDLATMAVNWSAETHRIFETDPAAWAPTHAGFLAAVHPEDRAAVDRAFQQSLFANDAQAIEHRLLLSDGRVKFVEERWQVFSDPAGRPLRAVGTCQEITERKLADLALRESNEKFHQLVDNISDAFWVRSPDMKKVEYLSPAFEKIWGRSRATLLAEPGQWVEFILPEDRERVRSAFADLMQDRPSVDLEYRITWPGGEVRWVRVRGFQVRDQAGRLVRLTGIATDITKRKQAEAQLRLLEASVAHLNDLVVITEAEPLDEPGPRIVYVNEAFVRLTGYTRDEAIGRSPRFLQGPKTSRAALGRIKAALQQRQPVREELVNYSKTGREYWLEVEIVPVTDAGGRVTHAIAIERDVTERKLAEETLRNNEALLRMASEVSRLGAWRVELPGMRMIWSEEVSAIHETPEGFAPSLEQGIEFYSPEYRARIQEAFERCVQTGTPFDEEMQIITAKGTRRWVRVLGEAARDETGKITQVQGTIQDITDRKAAEARLHREESLMELAGKVSKVAGWSLTEPDMKLYWSRQVWEMVDYPAGQEPTPEELLQYYLPESRKKLSQAITRCSKTGQAFDLELQLTTPAGRAMWARVAGEADYDAQGRIQAVHGAFSDITARKQAEQELRRTNRSLQLLSHCNEALIRAEQEKDLLGEICRIAVEQGGYRMAWVGYAQEDERRTITPIAHAGVEEDYLTEINITWDENQASGRGPAGQVIRSGQTVVYEDIVKVAAFAPWLGLARKRGYSGVICLPLREAGRTFGLLGLYSSAVTQTGTEELKLLQELADDLAFGILNLRARLERRRTHEAVLAMARGISASSGSDFFEQLTHSLVEALGAHAGYTCHLVAPGQKIAHTLAAVVAGRTVPNFAYPLAGTPCEHLEKSDDWIVPRDASRLYPQAPNLATLGIEAYVGTKLHDMSGRIIGLMFVLFRQTLEQTEFIVSTLRIFAARAAAEIARNEAEAKTREQAALIDEARDAIIVRDLTHRITFWSRGAERLYGWTPAEAQGRLMGELLKPTPEKFHEAIGFVLRDGAWSGEIQKTTRSGATLTLDARWTLLRDAAGEPKSILAIDTDITERKKLEQQFLRAQRMESIGTLAGGIAHDLNNLLAPITMGVDLLKLFEPNPRSLPVIENIERSAKRGADLVKQVLSFARGVEGSRVTLQVRHILKEVESIAENTFPKNITVETSLPQGLWPVLADPTQLNQVVLNLCVNARDAMPGGGRLELAASNAELDAQYAAMNRGMAPGRYVVIQVTDTGTGMPKEIIDRIFEPFFTTKELGKGTGLGLSTVLGIVRSHGGFVNVYSEVGKGSSFKVYLPALAEGDAGDQAGRAEEALPRGNGELILVVDDEVSILDITKQTLQAFGYRVATAEDGAQAISRYALQRDEVAVVLTDMMMPVMDGPALIAALRRINPQVRIIGASGLNANGSTARAAAVGVKHFLPKPYSADALLAMIRHVLRDGGSRPPI
jgi:PAS domain S-box-containing protein